MILPDITSLWLSLCCLYDMGLGVQGSFYKAPAP